MHPLRKVSTFCDYPEVQNELIDEKLEADMDNVLKLVVMGRACRNASNIKKPSADRTDVRESRIRSAGILSGDRGR